MPNKKPALPAQPANQPAFRPPRPKRGQAKPYQFAKYEDKRTDVKPNTETTRLLELAMSVEQLDRASKDRLVQVLYGAFGSGTTYKLGGWAWEMHCLPRFLVKIHGCWAEYHALDKASLCNVLSDVDEIVEAGDAD